MNLQRTAGDMKPSMMFILTNFPDPLLKRINRCEAGPEEITKLELAAKMAIPEQIGGEAL
jgi:hypothetical protein